MSKSISNQAELEGTSVIKPILYNAEMVQAVLDDEKTATRRIAKNIYPYSEYGGFSTTIRGKKTGPASEENIIKYKSPYQTGDILYVRETIWQKTWRTLDIDGETKSVYVSQFKYAATDDKPETGWDYTWSKRPSIHMPKEAARIWLKVTGVRIEHLQDMTLNDFLNEGISVPYEAFNDPENAYMQAKKLFMNIWDSTINKKQRHLYGWDANPLVWVIEFVKCAKPTMEKNVGSCGGGND